MKATENEKNSNAINIATEELHFQNEEKEKTTVEKLKKANRLYSFISEINKTITHITDEQLLFSDACRIACKFGNFRMAWIEKTDTDHKTLHLAGNCGIPEDKMSLFSNVFFDKKGPRDYVLRTGNSYISNNIQSDLKSSAWKNFATANGIQSCMVLPLKRSGKLIATFNLYSAETDFFDAEEISMLEEVRNDISFGLDLIEKAKKHSETQEAITKNENRFRALIEHSTDMKTLSTPEGEILYGSPAITRILGYSNEEFLNLKAFDIIHPEDNLSGEAVNDILQNPQKSFNIRQRMKHKNGNYIWCEGIITNLLYEPDVNALVSNFRDISYKKLFEDQREFDTNNLNALINNTADLMWSVDRNFNLITSNIPFDEAGKVNFGKAIIRGESVLLAAHTPEMHAHFKQLYERAFAGESFTETEHFSHYPREFWTEISYCPIRKGDEIIGSACHSRDISELKKSELLVKESEAFTLAILNTLNSHIAVINESGEIIAVNKSWNEFALANGETTLKRTGVGTDYFDVCKKSANAGNNTAKEALEGFDDIIKKRTLSFRLEYPCNSPESQRWFEMRALKFEGDEPMLVVAHSDISDRKFAEENLKLTNAELSSALNDLNKIMDSSLDVICAVDENGIFRKVSAASEKVWGYKPEELIGKPLLDFVYHADNEITQQTANEVMKGKAHTYFENRYIRKDGSPVNMEWSARWDAKDKMRYGVARDVTEQVLSRKKIEESEARLNEAQILAKVGNWETDLETMKVIWSAETFRIFEIDPDDFRGSHATFLEHIHPEDLVKTDVAFKNSFNNDLITSIEHRIITPSGHIKTVEERWHILHDTKGLPVRAVGTCQDISERKKAEIEREKLTTDLIQRNRDLEQFTYIVSHNLRAPTANIMGFAETLQNERLTPEEQKEFLQGLSTSVSSLDSVIKDINSILQVKLELNEKKEWVSFSKLVSDILINIGDTIDKQGVQIKPDFSEVDEIFSLNVYLHSIFYNLISNSIKYSKPNEEALIEIKSRKEKGKIILTFKDNGLGMDLKTKGDKIFGLYKRFHLHVEGKGMGLFMVKTQVEAIRGKITVNSELNKGTEFTIVFDT